MVVQQYLMLTQIHKRNKWHLLEIFHNQKYTVKCTMTIRNTEYKMKKYNKDMCKYPHIMVKYRNVIKIDKRTYKV